MEEVAGSVFSASASLIAGYSFLRLSYCRRFLCASLATDRYAPHVLGYSFVFFALGEVAAELIPYWTPRFLALPAKSLSAAGFNEGVINCIALALAIGVGDNLRVYWLMRNDIAHSAGGAFGERVRRAAVERFICGSMDAALRTIFRATRLNKPLMLTLKSHKVYVGHSYLMPWDDPSQGFAYIKIFPTRSAFEMPSRRK